jgi:hypothetical protein
MKEARFHAWQPVVCASIYKVKDLRSVIAELTQESGGRGVLFKLRFVEDAAAPVRADHCTWQIDAAGCSGAAWHLALSGTSATAGE